MRLVSLIAVRPGEFASDWGKLVFDKTPPATIDRYNRRKLFWLGIVDPSIGWAEFGRRGLRLMNFDG